MRYDTPIFFQRVIPGKYEENGNYGEDTITEAKRYASVSNSGIETLKLVYGEIKQGSLTIRLQQPYKEPFDRIRIGDKIYKVDAIKPLRVKQSFVVSEVQGDFKGEHTTEYDLGYSAGLVDGESIGYDKGKTEGEQIGYTNGLAEGEAIGYAKGETDGYQKGQTAGEESGYNKGLSEGESIGYEKGHSAGYTEGEEAGQQAEYDRFWDGFQENGSRTVYMLGFAGRGWNKETFNPKHPIKVRTGSSGSGYMFWAFNSDGNAAPIDYQKFKHLFDWSNLTNATSMFADAGFDNLEVDFSRCTSLNNTFSCNYFNGKIATLKIKVTATTTSYSNAFLKLYSLVNLSFFEDSVISANISFADCPNLSAQSLQNIIDVLATTTSTRTITFHSSAANKLTVEQITQIAAKGWKLG